MIVKQKDYMGKETNITTHTHTRTMKHSPTNATPTAKASKRNLSAQVESELT